MEYRQDHTWREVPRRSMSVCRHDDNVSLNALSVYMEHGHGFSIHFKRKHIPRLEELLKTLRTLPEESKE